MLTFANECKQATALQTSQGACMSATYIVELIHNKTTGAQTQQTIERSISEYTSARHHVLIALRCAVSKQPFNMVKDSLYSGSKKCSNVYMFFTKVDNP